MIIHNDIQQNTEEWLALRVGKFTASIAADLLMDKGNKGYKNLIAKITEERFTGQACESKKFQGNAFTDRGHLFEPLALNDYSTKFFYDVQSVGFVEADNHLCGCSPDGLINDDGMIQVKCPIFATQIEYLKTQKVPGNYYKQMQFELFVTEREYNIFYSYHPKLKAVHIKLHRDEELIAKIKEKLEIARGEVECNINKIKGIK